MTVVDNVMADNHQTRLEFNLFGVANYYKYINIIKLLIYKEFNCFCSNKKNVLKKNYF